MVKRQFLLLYVIFCLLQLAAASNLLAQSNDQQVAYIESLRQGMQKVIDEDSKLGAQRNQASHDIPLHIVIRNYVNAIRGLDFTQTPAPFQKAFLSHAEAWESAIPLFRQHASLRGELHQIFDQVRLQNEAFPAIEKSIGDSWDDIETVLGFYQSTYATKRFVFTSTIKNNSDIYLSKLHQKKWQQLTRHRKADNWPVVSPDKQKILFQSRRNQHLDIYQLELKTKNLIRLTDNAAHDYLPEYSVDGAEIFFTRRPQSVDGVQSLPLLMKMPVEGGEAEQWFPQSPNNSTGVSWSRSGQLGLITVSDQSSSAIFLVSRTGRVIKQLTSLPGYNGGGQFSPDDSKVVFFSQTDSYSAIGMIELTSSQNNITWLRTQGFYWQPRFSDDGNWLTMTRSVDVENQNLDIVVIAVDNPSIEIPLVNSPARDSEFRWLD